MSKTEKRLSLLKSSNITFKETDDDSDQEKQQRDWSDLTPDIIYSIMQRLDYIDLIRCHSVCKDWSAIANQLKPRQGSPWLVKFYVTPSPNGSLGTHSLYNLSKGKEYQSCYYPILDSSELDKHCSFKLYASKYGWIFFMVTNYRFRPSELFCYNPFSRKKIKLPSLTIYSEFETKGSISTNPASSDCMFFLVDYVCTSSGNTRITKIMTYTYGDATWDESFKLSYRDDVSSWAIQDVVYCNGFLYCAIQNGLLGAFDIANRNWNLIETIYPSRALGNNFSRLGSKLLNSNEELLMVAFYHYPDIEYSCKDVYRLDHNNMRWIRLEERLDDNRAFFVDPFGSSISTIEEAKSCELEGGRIYNIGHEIFFHHSNFWSGIFPTSFTTSSYNFPVFMDPC